MKKRGYKLLYLEDIDKGDPYFTKNEKLKIYLLKPEIFNSDYYGLFSDVANSTCFDCSYFFNKHDIDKEFKEY